MLPFLERAHMDDATDSLVAVRRVYFRLALVSLFLSHTQFLSIPHQILTLDHCGPYFLFKTRVNFSRKKMVAVYRNEVVSQCFETHTFHVV